jgi:FAD/FMN-containing dehydrogenase
MTNIRRRALLSAGAVVGATVLAGGDPGAAGAAARTGRGGPPGLQGKVFVPGDAGYDAEVRTYDLSQVPAPGLVVAAADVSDVRAAVGLAASRHAPVAVMATGHQPSVPIGGDAVLVTTRAMNHCTIDRQRRIARVEAGLKWQPVVEQAVKVGLSPLVGSSGDVGVVGYTLGGGLSPVLGRKYGYAADHVRRIEVVTADGRFRRVTANSDAELFFGLRGGKSNFGIVTAIEFDLFPITSFYGGAITFDGRESGRLLHAYRTWVKTVPEEMSSSVALMRMPDLPQVPAPVRGKMLANLRIAYVGDAKAGERLVRPLRALAEPIVDGVMERPFTAFNDIHQDPLDPAPAYERTSLLRDLPAAAIDALLSVAGPDKPYPATMVEVRHLGGALARQPGTPDAVSHRDAGFTLFTVGPAPTVRDAEAALIQTMAPFSTGGLYVNFMSSDDPADAVPHAYTPEVYRRLQRLKRRVDPDNMFRLNQNIRPA